MIFFTARRISLILQQHKTGFKKELMKIAVAGIVMGNPYCSREPDKCFHHQQNHVWKIENKEQAVDIKHCGSCFSAFQHVHCFVLKMADRHFFVLYLMLVPSNNSEYFPATCHGHKEKRKPNPIGIKNHFFVIQNLSNTVTVTNIHKTNMV